MASSDMMSMETTKRVWQAHVDPRRNTPSVEIYSHVPDRRSVLHAQLEHPSKFTYQLTIALNNVTVDLYR